MSPYSYKKEEVIIELENISLDIGDKKILRDINLKVHDITREGRTQGQVVGLLGASGIGKSQLFEIMSGLKPPTTGTVKAGFPLQPVKSGRMGVVAQNYPLFKQYTVGGNLGVSIKKNKSVKKEERKAKVDEMLELFHLQDHKDKYPAQLSGGQRQRVAIAQQLLCSDNFLLLDEPFSGLDPLMLKKVCDLITTIVNRHEHNTVVVVTHDLTAAALISDRLWVLGREKDEKGIVIPGATVTHDFNLIDIGLAWRPDIEYTPDFVELTRKLKSLFIEP